MKLDTERERVGHHNRKWLLLVTHLQFFNKWTLFICHKLKIEYTTKHLTTLPLLFDGMSHILFFLCLCPYLSSYLYSHLSSRQREYQQGQAGRTLLVSSLSQFKIKSIFHRSTPTQSHTPMFTKLNPNIYKWVKRRRLSYPAEWNTGFVVYIFNALNI